MSRASKRFSILSDSEVQELFDRPRFSADDQLVYFSLDPDESLIFESLRYISTRLLFLLQLGYFKASHRFFVFTWSQVQADLSYLLQRYFPQKSRPETMPDKNTRLAQQKIILQCQNYRSFNQSEHRWLSDKARQLVRIHAQPRFLLTELLQLLDTERIMLPGYSTFQKIIGGAIQDEQQRLNTLIQALPEPITTELDALLSQEGSFYQLTALKKRAKDFSLKQVRGEIQKHGSIHELYRFARQFLPGLQLSPGNIHYYASLAEYYPVYQLRQMERSQAWLYLLCFVQHCFEQISDNLITTFIYQVSTTTQEAVQHGQQRLADYHQENQQQLRKAGQLVKFFVDPDIDEQQLFREIKQQAFAIMDEAEIQRLLDYLSGQKLNRLYYEWDYLRQQARKTALNIRPLFVALELGSTLVNDPLIAVAQQLRAVYQAGKSSLPIKLTQQIDRMLPKRIQPWVSQPAHYEWFIYQQLRDGLDAGDIFYRASTRFKSFDDDLLSPQQMREQQPLLASLGYPALTMPMAQRLATLKRQLEPRYREVNDHILDGKNTHLKLEHKDNAIEWTLPYRKQEDRVNNPFYDQLPHVGIIDVLHYVDQHCHFLKAFHHIQPRYAKSQADSTQIMACLVAYGERIGLHTMADLSDMKAHLLRTGSNNYIRLETTRQANDLITDAIAQLPLFEHYNLDMGALHASADGQKFETQRATFKARYSKKYFGLNKGLVNYTLVANHVPVNARLIGANEHESHYAFDIVFNNTSDIDPDIISTDMAGTNQVNFALLETFGRTWAPRYTQINRKALRLVGFHPPGSYPSDDIIIPSSQINESLILTEADNLQRIFASMALKTMTQSTLVRKLSSYARKNRTKKALWELDNIYMSLYVLNYIDDETLRRNVQRALNRGEAYHQLQRAITHPNGGRFRGTTEYDMAIESDCSRLIANAIIYYNIDLLSRLWLHLKSQGREKEAEWVQRLSPVAWRHINLFGRYEFYGDHLMLDVDEIIRNIHLA